MTVSKSSSLEKLRIQIRKKKTKLKMFLRQVVSRGHFLPGGVFTRGITTQFQVIYSKTLLGRIRVLKSTQVIFRPFMLLVILYKFIKCSLEV